MHPRRAFRLRKARLLCHKKHPWDVRDIRGMFAGNVCGDIGRACRHRISPAHGAALFVPLPWPPAPRMGRPRHTFSILPLQNEKNPIFLPRALAIAPRFLYNENKAIVKKLSALPAWFRDGAGGERSRRIFQERHLPEGFGRRFFGGSGRNGRPGHAALQSGPFGAVRKENHKRSITL